MLLGQVLNTTKKLIVDTMATQRENVYLNVLATAVSAAEKAGKIIRQVMSSGNLEIVLKGVNDPQTAADRSAQVTILSILSKRFPKLTIIGEEDDDIGKLDASIPDCIPSETVLNESCPSRLKSLNEEDIVVWVDPLDGTNEFTKGLVEHVTVLIGLAVNGEAVGGVIHQPYWGYEQDNKSDANIGRTIWGTNGGNIGGLVIKKTASDNLVLATTRSHSNESVEAAIKSLGASEVLRVGGAGYKVLLLLEGKAHCYVFPTPGCKRWDTCSPEAILRAAGGILTDTNGKKYSYAKDTNYVNRDGVLAALDPNVHRRCLEVLNLSKT